MEYYAVISGDTLQSIADRYHVTIDTLKSLNNMDSDPLPGTQLVIVHQELPLINETFYCTRLGKVKGNLIITEHAILFDPIRMLNGCEMITSSGKEIINSARVQLFIDLNDVIHCEVIELQETHRSIDFIKVFYIELMLSRVGYENKGIRSDIPKINVYFKLSNQDSNGEIFQYLQLKTRANQIIALVSSSLKNHLSIADSGTFVPFYDINKEYLGRLNSGLEKEDDNEEFKQCLAHLRNIEAQQQEHYELPTMSSNSRILTPKIVSQLLANIPSIYQYRTWELLFSNYLHGRSLRSFYSQIKGNGPNILIIKDEYKYIFGGYFSCRWKKSFTPYGDGDCFLFTFRNNELMTKYYSTSANNYYMSSDHEAIIIGSGGHASIFIDKNLEAGTSGRSKTYNNEVLSGGEHFQILDIEVWGLI